MRLPSDAQAQLLACLKGHEDQAETVCTRLDGHHSRIPLYVEWPGSEIVPLDTPLGTFAADAADIVLAYASLAETRVATLNACVRAGWLGTSGARRLEARRIGCAWNATGKLWQVTVTVLDLTEDGMIALGAWQQRKLNAPSEPPPALEGADRDIVVIAEHANRLGFALLPVTDRAKRTARKLARTPFARRGFGAGIGTRSLEPTALGAVEVNPQHADRPQETVP